MFPNDNGVDYLLLNENEDFEYNYLYEGKLKIEGVEVDMILPDEDDDPPDEYTIVSFFSKYSNLQKVINRYTVL